MQIDLIENLEPTEMVTAKMLLITKGSTTKGRLQSPSKNRKSRLKIRK